MKVRSKKSIVLSILLSVCLMITQAVPVFAENNIENTEDQKIQEEEALEYQEENKQPESETLVNDENEETENADQASEEEIPEVQKQTAVKSIKERAAVSDSKDNETETEDVIKDGTYKPDDFTFSGGTGRVTITCPEVIVKEGKATARIVFSSASYTKLQVNGVTYISIVDSSAKTSTFCDVAVALNQDVTITGTTEAMGEPKDIEYVIHIKLSSNSQETEATDPGENTGGNESKEESQEPIISKKLSNGTYKVKSDTDNRMFYIQESSDGKKWSVLKVKSTGMEATITLTGTGYDYLYMGTTTEAAKASKSKLCKYKESNGYYSYTIPVSALDKNLTISAHSAKRDAWYEHTIIFYSNGAVKIKDNTTSVVPNKPNTSKKNNEANGKKATNKQTSKASKSWKDESGKGTSAVDNSTKLKDGTYTPAGFSWSGGTGRLAYIKCSKIIVKNGQAFGVIEFGSTKYDQLKANGRIYSNSNSGGLSTFVIPVQLNANNTIIARTTAMSQTHWIQYSIYISLPVKQDGTADTSQTQVQTEKLSNKAPEIMGLEYDSTIEVENAEYFKLYKYNDGIVLLQIDVTKDTALYKKAEQKKEAAEDEEAVYDEDGKLIAKSQHEITMELYQNNIINYLLIPEGAELPAGLEKSYVIVEIPADSTFTSSDKVSEMLGKMKLSEYVSSEADKGLENIDYKSIVKNKTNLCIISSDVLPDAASKDMSAKEKKELEAANKTKKELLKSVELKFTALDIPVLIDRSEDEKDQLAEKEWIKVYGALYGAQEQADSLYESYKGKVKQ